MIKKILCLPGYLIVGFIYFFPTETGKNRNTVTSSRWWSNREAIVPFISFCFYLALGLISTAYNQQKQEEVVESPTTPPKPTKIHVLSVEDTSNEFKQKYKSKQDATGLNISAEENANKAINDSEPDKVSKVSVENNSTFKQNDEHEPIERSAQRLLNH